MFVEKALDILCQGHINEADICLMNTLAFRTIAISLTLLTSGVGLTGAYAADCPEQTKSCGAPAGDTGGKKPHTPAAPEAPSASDSPGASSVGSAGRPEGALRGLDRLHRLERINAFSRFNLEGDSP